jgi:hypothetical protein
MIDDWTIDGQVNIRNYKLMMNRSYWLHEYTRITNKRFNDVKDALFNPFRIIPHQQDYTIKSITNKKIQMQHD